MVRRSAPALPRPDRSPDRGVEPGGRLLGTVMGTRREYLHYTHRECERYAKPCGRRHGTTLSAAAAACGRRAGLPSHTVAQPGPTCKCDYTSRRVAHTPRRRPEGAGARRSVRFARGRPLPSPSSAPRPRIPSAGRIGRNLLLAGRGPGQPKACAGERFTFPPVRGSAEVDSGYRMDVNIRSAALPRLLRSRGTGH